MGRSSSSFSRISHPMLENSKIGPSSSGFSTVGYYNIQEMSF